MADPRSEGAAYDGMAWNRQIAGTSSAFFGGGSAFEAEILALDAATAWAASTFD